MFFPRARVGKSFFSLAIFVLLPLSVHALEISGWVPYWRVEQGVQSILPNLASFTEVNPFIYTVKSNGALNEASSLTESTWVELRREAKARNVRLIPTITWASPDAIDAVLRDPVKRQAHVQVITREVFAHNMDGIDIDYEGKYAKTRPYFSLFLKELNESIGFNKWVMCTIEARTPLDSRFATPEDIPKDIEYANDFSEINKYCDRVRIMAYAQGRFDLKLNAANSHPYAPVADNAWVEKVMKLAAVDIDTSKLVIGVPTYGYEYDMFTDNGTVQYSRLWSFNPSYAVELSGKLGIATARSPFGEMVLTYPASRAPDGIIPLPNATRILFWSDASSVADKAALAKKMGLRGIAVFKIDGGEDQRIGDVLAQYTEDAVVTKQATPSTQGAGVSLSVPNTDLEFGMRREEVRVLQKLLNTKGFTIVASGGGSPGNETIYFGPATRAALIRFQKAHGVPATGYFGPKTRATLRASL